MNSAILSNPFYQPARQWQIRVFIDCSHFAAVEEAFEDVALSVSSFETSEDSNDWRVDIITATALEESEIQSRMALLSGLLNIPMPRAEIEAMETRNWVAEVEKGFPPLNVGRFFVHGSHVHERPTARIALEINAGGAFGSGEHATTSGCLLALSQLAKRRRFRRPLDMGCGSGILAIAMARLFHCKVTGIDIDPVSARVSAENARRNRVAAITRFAAGDGYNTALVRAHAPYDLIMANILARPLVRMAPDLARNLASGGIAILSGLLGYQSRKVLHAHQTQGLRLIAHHRHHNWSVLVLKKG